MVASVPAWLWAVFTVTAAGAQTLRNAMQRDLITSVGTAGATYVRFLFGLPFALVFLAVVRLATQTPLPSPGPQALGWIAIAALAQILATGLMLAAMRERSFVVTTAYTKTEAVQIAVFGIVFAGERPGLTTLAAILGATFGVLLMSWPKPAQAGAGAAHDWRPAVFGLTGAAFFALSVIWFRLAILDMAASSFVVAASTTLVIGLVFQCTLILAMLALRDRATLKTLAAAWRSSLFAGFMGAFASQFWFLAFAIDSATRVRTLALIEVLFAQIVSRRLFKQGTSARDLCGMALLLGGVLLLINA